MLLDENMLCPVCKAKLFTDEVAHCPDCGAPHHKACFLALGHCAYADKHGTDEQWKPTKIEPPVETSTETTQESQQENTQEPKFSGEFNNSRVVRENPFFKANGIDKDEDIGGISAEEIAKFVGYNALRYIKIFRKMTNFKKKISWNWVAFLLPEYWLISRKCYFESILLGLYSVLVSVLTSFGMANAQVQSFIATGYFTEETLRVISVILICSVVTLVINLLLGMFGDYIYKKRVYSTINEMKSQGKVQEIDYIQKGGVNLMLPALLYFGMNVLVMIIDYIV